MPRKYKPSKSSLPDLSYEDIHRLGSNTSVYMMHLRVDGNRLSIYQECGSRIDDKGSVLGFSSSSMANHVHKMFKHRIEEVNSMIRELISDMKKEEDFCRDNRDTIALRVAKSKIINKRLQEACSIVEEAHS